MACPVLPKLFPCHVGAGGCRSHSLPDSTSRQVPNFRVLLHAQAYALYGFFWATFAELWRADGKGLGLSPWIAANCWASTLMYTRAKLSLRFLHMVVAMINSLPKVGCCWNHRFQSERTFNIFWRSKQTTFVANFLRTKQHSRGTQCPRNTSDEDFEVQDFRWYSNRSANS